MISWYSDSSCITVPRTFRSVACVPASVSPEELLCSPDAVSQRVDLVRSVVQVEAGPGRRLDAEGPVQRPGAVMTGAHGDAELVEHLAGIVRMHLVDDERHGAAAVLGGQRPEHPHALDAGQRFERLAGQ